MGDLAVTEYGISEFSCKQPVSITIKLEKGMKFRIFVSRDGPSISPAGPVPLQLVLVPLQQVLVLLQLVLVPLQLVQVPLQLVLVPLQLVLDDLS
jgi:hypothetical protein